MELGVLKKVRGAIWLLPAIAIVACILCASVNYWLSSSAMQLLADGVPHMGVADYSDAVMERLAVNMDYARRTIRVQSVVNLAAGVVVILSLVTWWHVLYLSNKLLHVNVARWAQQGRSGRGYHRDSSPG